MDKLEQYKTLCDDILARWLDNDVLNIWDDEDLLKRLQEIKNG